MNQPLALIIEDDPNIAQLYAIAVATAGFHTEKIDSGLDAVRRMMRIVPDLVVLDMCLPEADGMNLLEGIRAHPRFAQTRVMVATGHAGYAEQAREKADLVLLKPVRLSHLRDLAKRLRPPDSQVTGSPNLVVAS